MSGTGAPGSGSLSSQYDVYAADIDLVDDTPPTVSGVSGPLVAGGTLTGQQAISFNAADSQSGVYSGSLVVDGSHRRLADPRHQRRRLPVPERNLRRAAILRTRPAMQELGERQPDAQHQPAGGRPALARADRRRCRRQPRRRLQRHDHDEWSFVDQCQRWIDQRGADVTNAGASPTATRAPARRWNSRSTASVSHAVVPYGKSVMVRGVLHCGTVPIRDARVAIATLGGPASAAIDTSVQSALDGSFSYKVPRGPDRTLGSATPRTAMIPVRQRPRPRRS